jgi:ribosomal protein S12 methylthiotransferase accessory factor
MLTIPFYSLFEKKYVYLPVNFVDHMYSTNGCCAGNTREEAWVHALSEMMERHASIKMLLSGKAAPKIPKEALMKYPTVSKILNQLMESGEFEVDIFDYSIGNGFPVVSTRIISKKDHGYRVNVAADPVFEIAVQRTLTELFQGKNLDNVTKYHNGDVLGKISDIAPVVNVINQLETSSGLYTAEYFANELTCTKEPAVFPDNSNQSNKQLLTYMLGLYKQLNKPVYVRNFSYLGFPCYRFVVPGFSEALAVRFGELIPEYVIADEVSGILRNAKAATTDELSWMLNYSNMIRGVIGRYNFFSRISGIPLTGLNSRLCGITRAYASYRLGMYQQSIGYINGCIKALGKEDSEYFKCVNRYLTLKLSGVSDNQIKSILSKFFERSYVQKLYDNLDAGKTPYDDYLIACDFKNCDQCQYQQYCSFENIKELNAKVGAVYRKFVDGQAPSEFAI